MLRHIGIATLTVGLLAGATALADEQHHAPSHSSGGGHPQSSHAPMGGMSHTGPMPSGMGSRERSAPIMRSGQMNAPRGSEVHSEQMRQVTNNSERTENRRAENRTSRHESMSTTEHAVAPYRGGTPNYGHTANGYGRRPSNWNHPPRNFSKSAYQHNYTASHRFHHGLYRRPSGWYYRRWAYGEILPSIFWARNYWLTDWWLFDLPIPPYGYVWVRYGDDAILINTFTGEILEVEYGLFY